ncbi:MAG: bifunctional pyr operon transcriptional regulator/uracil phosphoribosyltransferase PyrR [Planctomycetota bacterium]|jgi:pyrimidine operon attenuation protein/uracil phosphoribosyltransferase
MTNKTIMDAAAIGKAVDALAEAIAGDGKDLKSLAIIGVRTRGVPLAQRIMEKIEKKHGVKPKYGVLDITLYRDDVALMRKRPIIRGTDINFPVDDLRIVLVDDVLFTGRTVRAALDQIVDFGRPSKIELAVLVDRGGRELPIMANHVGTAVDVKQGQRVTVSLNETDGKDSVILESEERS